MTRVSARVNWLPGFPEEGHGEQATHVESQGPSYYEVPAVLATEVDNARIDEGYTWCKSLKIQISGLRPSLHPEGSVGGCGVATRGDRRLCRAASGVNRSSKHRPLFM